MSMLEYLERDRTSLEESLLRDREGKQISRTLEQELDRLLLLHNEDCEDPRERSAAASMVRVLRLAMPLVDTVGETRIWERKGSGTSAAGRYGGRTRAWKLWMSAGAVCLAAVLCLGGGILLPALRGEAAGGSAGLLALLGVFLGGCLFSFYRAGAGSRGTDGEKDLQVEVRMDGKKVLRQLQTALIGMDQSLEELRVTEKREQEDTDRIQAADNPAEWDLFAALLEAAYSRDGDFALDQLDQVRHYLRRQGVEVVDCTEENRQMFDVMPSAGNSTLRPALVRGGKVLKKGLAAEAVH